MAKIFIVRRDKQSTYLHIPIHRPSRAPLPISMHVCGLFVPGGEDISNNNADSYTWKQPTK